MKFSCIVTATLAMTAAANAQPLDTSKSVVTVRVYKAGIFSALGHDHEISAPVSRGDVNLKNRSVELHFNAAALTVRDPGTSDKDRAEIQTTMRGPQVLDAQQYPEITFQSTSADAASEGAWNVRGNLTLHGQTHAVDAEVREKEGHYVGNTRFRLTDFGIKPIKIAGGTVRVKDEVQIEFDVQLAR